MMHAMSTIPANNIWLQQRSTTLGESCENVGKLSCYNIFQESFKNVAKMLPQNVVRKHLRNIHSFILTTKKCYDIHNVVGNISARVGRGNTDPGAIRSLKWKNEHFPCKKRYFMTTRGAKIISTHTRTMFHGW